MIVRSEETGDCSGVYSVNKKAFETDAEASLVEVLRKEANPFLSLVAEQGGSIVGHILFTPVTLSEHENLKIMGLGPVAVVPAQQNKGIGSALVKKGLEGCQQLGYGAVVVLGHIGYYPRFGFKPAAEYGIGCEYDVPEGAFMALELEPGYLQGAKGTIRYHPAFNDAT